jgi:PTS system galactitol-specific IIC component
MQAVIDALNYVAALGPMVMMPIVILIIGLILRVKFNTLFRSALLVGVGFAGVNAMVGFFVGGVGPAIQNMVSVWGFRTDIMDVGWPARAAATWAFPMAAIVVLVVLGINILMLALRLTKCVMVDFWSYNHFVFSAALVWYITNNAVLAIIAAAVDAIITFRIADWTAPLAEEYFGLPGISFPTSNSTCWAPIAWLMEKIYQRIPGFRDLKADPEYIQQKFGILGEPLFVGLVLGAVIALLGQQSVKDVLVVAMTTASAMVLIPRMMQILMEGLLPLADAIREILSTRFKGTEFTIGVDAALTMANPSAIAVGILMVPTTLVIAAILPGNRLLPLPDIAVMSMWLAAWPVAFAKGNIIRGYITTVICIIILLWIGTDMAPIQTQLAVAGGFELPEGMKIIGRQDSGLHLLSWVLSKIVSLFF